MGPVALENKLDTQYEAVMKVVGNIKKTKSDFRALEIVALTNLQANKRDEKNEKSMENVLVNISKLVVEMDQALQVFKATLKSKEEEVDAEALESWKNYAEIYETFLNSVKNEHEEGVKFAEEVTILQRLNKEALFHLDQVTHKIDRNPELTILSTDWQNFCEQHAAPLKRDIQTHSAVLEKYKQLGKFQGYLQQIERCSTEDFPGSNHGTGG